MANEQDWKQNPATGTESDISKAQSQQQPPQQASQQQPESAKRQGQFETGQAGQQQIDQERVAAAPDEGLQGDTLAQQRTDIEGEARGAPERGEAESGFLGAEGQRDTSSELVEEEESQEDRQSPDAE